jgi:hypothetical protein
VEPGSAILISAEDALDDTVLPRLQAAGADVSRVHALEGVRRLGEEGKTIVRGFTLADIPALRYALQRTAGCKLVVIDPVSAYLSDSDSHNNAEIRGLLAPLAQLAAEFRTAVVMVTHLSKAGGARAMYRAMGSLAFIAAARAAYLVVKDKDDERRRMLLPIKNNIGNDRDGLAYTIVDYHGQGRIEWERDTVQMRADDALAAEAGGPDANAPERDEASQFLTDVLSNGPRPAKELYAEAKAAGISKSTLDRAKRVLGIKPARISSGNDGEGHWVWQMPSKAHVASGARDDGGQDTHLSGVKTVSTLQSGEYLADFDPENAVLRPYPEAQKPQGTHLPSVSTLESVREVMEI